MAVSFYRRLPLLPVTVLARVFDCWSKRFAVKSIANNTTLLMPPKRKTAAAKVPKMEGVQPKGATARKGRPPKGAKKKVEEEEEEPVAVRAPVGRRGRAPKVAPPVPASESESEVETEPEPEPEVPVKRTRGRPGQKVVVAEPEPEEDAKDEEDESEEEEKPAAAQKTAKRGKATAREPAPLANQTQSDLGSIDFACAKENALGKQFNLKISNWNVDGLRACVKKDGLKYIECEDADIVCLQETKCSTAKLPDEVNALSNYKVYWEHSKKEGYAGVALLSKKEPLSVKYGIENAEFDEEGRCITAEYEQFYVISTYVPNAGRKLVTLPKRLKWNELFQAFVKTLDEKKPVIVCGDMNVAHNEIDLANPKTNTRNAGFTVEERDAMTDFLKSGFVDTYRKLNPDAQGVYTFWSYMNKSRAKNVGWRLDYFIVSERLMANVCDSVVRGQVFGSDHCPITLFINV